jgi:hypothetical protein
MQSGIGNALHNESIILNDEHEKGKVSGVRSQENRHGERKLIFLFPQTCDVTRPAISSELPDHQTAATQSARLPKL